MENTSNSEQEKIDKLIFNPEQEAKDKERNENTVIRKAEAIRLVENHFGDAIARMKHRSPEEQNLLGNCITVIEHQLIKELKALTEFQKQSINDDTSDESPLV